MTSIEKRDELTRILGVNIKTKLPELKKLLRTCNSDLGGVDGVYRFYHQSFKVFYYLQPLTLKIVEALKSVAPPAEPDIQLSSTTYPGAGSMNEWFMQIVAEGTGKTFTYDANSRWLTETRPIVEAFMHAKHFLEVIINYSDQLEDAPALMDMGYALLLSLYNLR